jgi:adsorption protein B
MEWEGLLYLLWIVCHGLTIGLVIFFVINGIDDLIVDCFYYTRLIFRFLFKRHKQIPLTLEKLSSVKEKPIALMIPAWHEANVIGDMLVTFRNTIKYDNWILFVGVYPNDPDTFNAVERARSQIPNVEVVVTPAPGPTSKSDCLNWIYQGILLHEKRSSMRFEIVLMHDAEDIVHPASLKLYNYLMPRFDFIQTPVVPLMPRKGQLVAGVYMDEFALSHQVELRMREFMTGVLPSAGVGTALTRRAMNHLAEARKNQIFDVTSLTEDYVMGLSLRNFDGRKIFLQQYLEMPEEDASKDAAGKRGKLEMVATKEFFPATFRTAVRQKSRWTLGICLQGWRVPLTWRPLFNYWLYRDRKGLINNLAIMLGYGVVAVFLFMEWAKTVFAGLRFPPLLTADHWVMPWFFLVFGFFIWRLFNRFVFTTRMYNVREGLLSIPRIFVGNFINFCATVSAIRQYVVARVTGRTPAWVKTEHAFPSLGALESFRQRLGEILLERRLVTEEQLEEAVEEQRRTGKRLGEIMVQRKWIWEEDLVASLAQQNGKSFVEIDPISIDPSLLEEVPEDLARSQRIFPISRGSGFFVLATDLIVLSGDDGAETAKGDKRERELAERFGCPVRLAWCSTADMEYALDRAYVHSAPSKSPGERLGEQLVRAGKITRDELQEVLREQKRSRDRIGSILVGMGKTTPAEIEEVLESEEVLARG